MQIKALEEELGVRLFDRMGKRVILTAQGQCFLEYANSILDTIHNARRALERGCRAGGLPAHRHAGISLLFPSARPDASVPGGTPQSQPSGHYRLPGRADRKMERGEVDLICILDEPRYSNSWHKCNEVPEEVVFVASPDIDLSHPGPYRVAELLDKPFFLTERNANYRRTFDRFWLPARSS